MPTTIYILGNLQTFVAALTGIQMIFNPANNTDWAMGGALFGVGPLVTIGLLVSLLHISTKGVWTQKLSLHHVGILLGLYAAMFVPTTSVTVQDIYTGQSQIVDGIPDGVAYPASIVSQLSYDAATQLGQAFQAVSATAPPTSIALGMAAPLRTMLQLRNMYTFFSKEQPGLARDEVLFVKQCVYPNATYNNWWQQIYSSNNILNTYASFAYPSTAQASVPYDATLAAANPAITCTAGGLCYGSCGSMAVAIDAAFQNWLTNNQSSGLGCSNAAGMSTAANAETNAPTTDCSGSGSFNSIMSAMGSSGMEYVSMIINSCINSAGMASGPTLSAYPQTGGVNNDFCTITTNSINQAQVDNAGSANVFLSNMLPLMSILQFLFIALAPLAAFTMVMAAEQGVQTFVKYIMFGLWTQSWLPVAALINDYSQITVQHQFSVLAAAATASAGSVTSAVGMAVNSIPVMGAGMDALTTTSLPIIIQQTMQVLSNADMMLAMTPVITMIVFTGSYFGMAQLAQGVGGEDNVAKNTGLTTPGVSSEEKAFGVSSPGNSHGAFVSLDSAYNGVGGEVSAGVQGALAAAQGQTATATVAAVRARSEAASATYNALEAAGQQQVASTAASVKGGQKIEEAFSNLHGLTKDTGISVGQLESTQLAYKAAIAAGNAGLAQKILSGLTKGLHAQQGNAIDKAIKNGEVEKWSNDLSNKDAADFVKSMSEGNNTAISHQTAQQVSHAIADSEKAEVQRQEAVAHQAKVEATASRVTSAMGKQKLDQGAFSSWFASQGKQLTAQSAEALALAGGGEKALAQLRANEQHIQSTTGDTGESLYAAALGLLSSQNQEATYGMAAAMYGGAIGPNPAQNFQSVQAGAKQQITQGSAAIRQQDQALQPAAARAEQAHQIADPNKIAAESEQAPPTYVQYENPEPFFKASEQGVLSKGQQIGFDKWANGVRAQVKNAPGMGLTQLAANNPTAFVAAIAAANLGSSLLSTAGKAVKDTAEAAAGEVAAGGEAIVGGAEGAAGAVVGGVEGAAGAVVGGVEGAAGAAATVPGAIGGLAETAFVGVGASAGVGGALLGGMALGAGIDRLPEAFGGQRVSTYVTDLMEAAAPLPGDAGAPKQLTPQQKLAKVSAQAAYELSQTNPQFAQNLKEISTLASQGQQGSAQFQQLTQQNTQILERYISDRGNQ